MGVLLGWMVIALPKVSNNEKPMNNEAGPEKPRYWFAAKPYGWGWGLPLTWEGWLVLLAYLILLPLAVAFFPPDRNMLGFIGSVFGLSGVLIAICWKMGEPPRWRWGGK